MTHISTLKQDPKIKVYNLSTKGRVVIGRSDSCQITINKPEISSRHAVIFHEADGFWMYDNDSANGTCINGKSTKGRHKLKFNDVIKVGNYNFKFVCEYVFQTGETYYLEIYKQQKNNAIPQAIDTNLPNEKKTPLLKKESKTDLGEKLSKVQKSRAQKKKRNQYLKKLGAGISDKVTNTQFNRHTIVSTIKRVSVVSILCHFVLVYFLVKLVVDSEPEKELKEIAINLQEEETLDIPIKVEVPEPELEINAVSNPEVQSLKSLNNSQESLIEAADDVELSDTSTNFQGNIGNISIGKGYNGAGDATFRKRVQKSNGRYNDLDIRLTLVWNGYSDLDLHAQTPNNGSIYYGIKEAEGGKLDIDQNASAKVKDPVENIIWAKAVNGDYTINVVLFNANKNQRRIPFKIEFQIFKDTYYYKGFFLKGEEKKSLEIVKFTCRDGKYLIHSSIKNQATLNTLEEGLDVLED